MMYSDHGVGRAPNGVQLQFLDKAHSVFCSTSADFSLRKGRAPWVFCPVQWLHHPITSFITTSCLHYIIKSLVCSSVCVGQLMSLLQLMKDLESKMFYFTRIIEYIQQTNRIHYPIM